MDMTWQDELMGLKEDLDRLSILDLLRQESNRFERFSLEAAGLFVDFSKQKINDAVMRCFFERWRRMGYAEKVHRLMRGEVVNPTEQRAAWHTQLRHPRPIPLVEAALFKMEALAESLRRGDYRPVPEAPPIRHVVALGIGGSALGPQLLNGALRHYRSTSVTLDFVTNVDDHTLTHILSRYPATHTLVVVSSKTFTTQETLLNARAARSFLQEAVGNRVDRHMVAITAALGEAQAFGIAEDLILPIWDWVGGRYSVWSTVAFPAVTQVGGTVFKRFLAGAHSLDRHFETAALEENLPAWLAAVGIWNRNFQGYPTSLNMPYDDGLAMLPSYLQQLEMESNGKRVDVGGQSVEQKTAPVIWGGTGCDGQHSYMQCVHQGTDVIPVEFIVPIRGESAHREHNRARLLSALAQSKALLEGVSDASRSASEWCPGDRPSTCFLMEAITPETLGALLALYEHRVFMQALWWNINPFDQYGVQLGKELAWQLQTIEDLDAMREDPRLDASTIGLLERLWRGIV